MKLRITLKVGSIFMMCANFCTIVVLWKQLNVVQVLLYTSSTCTLAVYHLLLYVAVDMYSGWLSFVTLLFRTLINKVVVPSKLTCVVV